MKRPLLLNRDRKLNRFSGAALPLVPRSGIRCGTNKLMYPGRSQGTSDDFRFGSDSDFGECPRHFRFALNTSLKIIFSWRFLPFSSTDNVLTPASVRYSSLGSVAIFGIFGPSSRQSEVAQKGEKVPVTLVG